MSRRQPPVETILVHVPFAIRKYGGRKRVITPNGEAAAIEKSRVDSTLVKALARAFRWKKMLESGQFTTITELGLAQMVEDDHRNLTDAQALRCHQAAVPGNDHVVAAGQDRIGETKFETGDESTQN